MKTRRKIMMLLVMVALVVLPLISGWGSEAASAKEITFRYSVPYPPKGGGSQPQIWFMDEVEKRTQGRIKFKRHFLGSVTKGGEELDAVKDRLIDCSTIGPWFYTGRLYLWTGLREIPFGISDISLLSNIVKEMYEQIPEMQNEIERYNQKILFQHPIAGYDIYSKDPIRTLDDMKGKKLGAIGTLGKWIEVLGATPVSSTLGERYTNTQTGAEDGGLLPFDTVPVLRLNELCKYLTEIELGCSYGMIFTINRDAWNGLSKEDQKLFLDLAEKIPDMAGDLIMADYKKAVDGMIATGIELIKLSAADKAQWAGMLPNVPKNYAAMLNSKGLPGTKFFDLYFRLAKKAGWNFYRDWWAK
jgi:TRAP-type C4-dicarboxylate transport system substrate-binding protein